jgi:hypothetical protein
MERYQTRRYVVVSWPEAIRLARLDGTPPDDIRQSPDVTLLHRTEWWVWWSDERLTTALGLPEELQPRGLSDDAEELISDAWMCDTIVPKDGWRLLAQVKCILSSERSSFKGGGNNFQYATLDKVVVEYQDGSSGAVYKLLMSYIEDYFYLIRIEN